MDNNITDSLMDNSKKYAVVKFALDNTYSEIPTAWLINAQQCWWPPRTTNVSTLMVADPSDETWNRYEMDIVKYRSEFSFMFSIYWSMTNVSFVMTIFVLVYIRNL